jgi:transposase
VYVHRPIDKADFSRELSALFAECGSTEEVARRMGVNVRTVRRWITELRAAGFPVAGVPSRGRPPKKAA